MSSRVRRERVVDPFTRGEAARPALAASDVGTRVRFVIPTLYFYAHEGPGEVRCHNVDLNGGLWWVVGPDGNRRP